MAHYLGLKYHRDILNDFYDNQKDDMTNNNDLEEKVRFLKAKNKNLEATNENFILEWLEIIDNMERALQFEDEYDNPWYQGVKAVYRQMLKVLDDKGVEEINPVGETFDPFLHEAVSTVWDKRREEGTITQVVRRGYIKNGKVLRAAQVIPVIHN